MIVIFLVSPIHFEYATSNLTAIKQSINRRFKRVKFAEAPPGAW